MANRLKVGFLKEVRLPQKAGIITALVVNDKTKWSCSEMIDIQLQEKLTKKGIFGINSIYVEVDNELAQTTGVRIIDDNISTKLDETIREYLKELIASDGFEKSLNNDQLCILQQIGALVKALVAITQENDSPDEDKWIKVITTEL